ncbi:MAG: diguanylate cyclase [Pirellulales bacterium]
MRYSLSAQGSNDGLWDWDLQTDRIHFSDRWTDIVGLPADSLGDEPRAWFDRVHPDDLPHVRRSLDEHRCGITPKWECEYRIRHDDESYRWVLTRGMAVRDAAGREVRMAGSQTDITRGKAADPLTGLPNRVLFVDHLSAAVEAAARESEACFAVLFLDLDRFKVVNDGLGHMAGDELLVVAARRLESCLRRTDVTARAGGRSTLSRFGGDEFVILLTGLKSSADAEAVADRILATMSEPLRLREHDVSLSASIGIAVSSGRCGASADDLLRDADTAMYRAKTEGKGRWCLFDQQLHKQAIERLELEADVKKGLQRGEFHVHYQPIVELPAQRVRGFEALLRWNHPTRGNVSPAVFVPVAEEIGCIVDLGTWVLREACRQVRQWQLESPGAASSTSASTFRPSNSLNRTSSRSSKIA